MTSPTPSCLSIKCSLYAFLRLLFIFQAATVSTCSTRGKPDDDPMIMAGLAIISNCDETMLEPGSNNLWRSPGKHSESKGVVSYHSMFNETTLYFSKTPQKLVVDKKPKFNISCEPKAYYVHYWRKALLVYSVHWSLASRVLN